MQYADDLNLVEPTALRLVRLFSNAATQLG
jgi:hypothetical protein